MKNQRTRPLSPLYAFSVRLALRFGMTRPTPPPNRAIRSEVIHRYSDPVSFSWSSWKPLVPLPSHLFPLFFSLSNIRLHRFYCSYSAFLSLHNTFPLLYYILLLLWLPQSVPLAFFQQFPLPFYLFCFLCLVPTVRGREDEDLFEFRVGGEVEKGFSTSFRWASGENASLIYPRGHKDNFSQNIFSS